MKKLCSFSLYLLLLAYWGCSKDTATGPGPITDNSVPNSQFSDIQKKVFTTTCALSNCHGDSGTQANLLLVEGKAYSNLVNVQSFLFPDFKRVLPDSSSKSLLIKILKGEVSPRMPLNGNKLSDATIDSISKWIDNGASNN